MNTTVDAIQEVPEEDIPIPKGNYSMDFDQFDDPNFNPFASKRTMQNSPPPSENLAPIPAETPEEISSVYITPMTTTPDESNKVSFSYLIRTLVATFIITLLKYLLVITYHTASKKF